MIFLGIYDAIVVSFFGGVDASISRFLQDTMFASPVFSFGLGAIFGHVALYMRPKWKNAENALMIVKDLSLLDKIQYEIQYSDKFNTMECNQFYELKEEIKKVRI